jgi:prepilin-type N-terminal cleavage/methylation domain-containing protein
MKTNRDRSDQSAAPRRPRGGFSLAEILMAMTLLSVVLLSLARVSMVVSERGRDNDLLAKRNAALTQEANKFGAMDFATLSAFSTANETITSGDFTYTRRLTITPTGTKRLRVIVVVVPSTDPSRVDSVIIDRSKSAGSPLCVGC